MRESVIIKPREPQTSSTARSFAIVVALVAILYLARQILIPLAFAVTLTLILTPAVGWLRKIHLGRLPAALAVLVISVIGAGGLGYIIFTQFIQVLNELPGYQQNIHDKIQAMRTSPRGAWSRATENVREIGKELSNEQPPVVPPQGRARRAVPAEPNQPLPVRVVDQPASELQYLRDLTRPFLAPLGMFGIVLIFTLFLLIEQEDLRNRLFRLAGLSRMNVMTQALEDATQRVSRYLMLLFVVNACFGTLVGIGLHFIGVPYPALWGALAAILRIVPYVGSTIAGLLPLLLSLAVFDKWMPPVMVLVMFLTLELVTANLLEPWLYGTHTGISSLALLLTTVFWTALWGPSGLILATPLTVCLVVLGRHVPQFSFLHILLGDEEVLAPEAQLYQRLLAMDHHGARVVVDQFLAEKNVRELYDSVIVPALSMLERDRHKEAIDADREEFIFLGVREMLGEFGDGTQPPPATQSGRIICLPANDESDEITAAMLAQLVEKAGCVALTFPSESKLQHLIQLVSPTEKDVFCISALPPFAFRHARALNRLLRRRFPTTRIVIGIWGFTGDTERALQRFLPSRPDKIVTSLGAAVEWICGGEDSKAVAETAEPVARDTALVTQPPE
jgi:predicted PurR-regulated permease PerM